ncbi:hypothetical protein ACP70R_015299 [Stipagrostis hirtigluma subsp. patula]
MSSSDEDEATSKKADPRVPCLACKKRRRRCEPECLLAPYFPPHGDPARYEALHQAYGHKNVDKLVAAVPPERRQDTVNSLVYEATELARDPVYGCVSYISILQHMIQQTAANLAASQGVLARYAGPEVAFRPFNPADVTPERRELSEATRNMLVAARAEDERQRALRQARSKGKDVAAPKQHDHLAAVQAKDKGKGVAESQQDDHLAATQAKDKGKAVDEWEEDDDLEALRLVAGAQNSAAAARAAKEQEMIMAIMRQDAAAQSYTGMMQPGAAEQGMMAQLPAAAPQHAGMGHGHPITNQETLLQMARAQQVAAALGLDVTLELDQQHQEQLMMMLQMARIQQLGAVAEHAGEQNMMMQHAAAAAAVPQYDAMAQYAAAMGLNVSPGNAHQLPPLHTVLPMAQAQQLAAGTSPQDMLMMQHPAAAQQQQQLAAMGLHLALGHGHPPLPRQQTVHQMPEAMRLATDVRTQQAAAVMGATHGSSSGGTAAAFQPPGTAHDADAFLVQQQPQDNVLGLQTDPALPLLPPALGQQGNDQVPNQQDMDGGDGDLASVLRPFLR